MTFIEQYRAAQAESARFRLAWQQATTKKAKREAADNLEFWSNKAAFLWNAAGRPK